MQRRQTVLALALFTAALLTPLRAAATPSDLDGDPFTGVAVVGSSSDGAEFLGTMDIQDFETRDGRLIALGTLAGQVTRTNGRVVDPVVELNAVPVDVPVGAVVARCDRLSLTFGPAPLELQAPVVQVTPIRIDGADQPVNGAMTAAQLCTLADQFRGVPAPSVQAGLLDGVRHAFDER